MCENCVIIWDLTMYLCLCLFLLLPLIMVGTNQLLWKSWVYARMQCLCWFLELLVTNSLVTIPVPLLSLTQLYWHYKAGSTWLDMCTHLLLIILSHWWQYLTRVCLSDHNLYLIEPAILLMFHCTLTHKSQHLSWRTSSARYVTNRVSHTHTHAHHTVSLTHTHTSSRSQTLHRAYYSTLPQQRFVLKEGCLTRKARRKGWHTAGTHFRALKLKTLSHIFDFYHPQICIA